MKKFRVSKGAILLLSIPIFWGCTKSYVITDVLEEPISPQKTCIIGPITDELPMGTEEGEKPSLEDIQKFKKSLSEELEKREIVTLLYQSDLEPDYEVTGSILEYKKGSGFLRFLFGAMAGSAKVVTNLKLVNAETNDVLFAGNFTGSVTSWGETGEQMFKRVSKDFSKQLEKQIKKLNESKKE
jgi:hypothetical protein